MKSFYYVCFNAERLEQCASHYCSVAQSNAHCWYQLLTLICFIPSQLFVVRELSPDTDIETYNKMIAVQHNPKFAHYFAAAAESMVTN